MPAFSKIMRFCGVALLAWLAALSAVRADGCRLEQAASLQMTQAPQGLLVPVTIEGVSKFMIVDTGAPLSTIDPRVASQLHLNTRRIRSGAMFTSRGRRFTEMASIPELAMGRMRAENLKFLVYPRPLSGNDEIAGLLGADFLRHYDVELDFGGHRINFFLQNHCPGHVVYWPADAVAVVPMRVTESGHIVVPVTLDGHQLNALLDTGAFGTILSLDIAKADFGLNPGSGGTPELRSPPNAAAPYYRHVFRSLMLQGISIGNPTVFLRANPMRRGMERSPEIGTRIESTGGPDGAPGLILGLNELRHLHLLISYAEQKLYITARSPGTRTSGPEPSRGARRMPSH